VNTREDRTILTVKRSEFTARVTLKAASVIYLSLALMLTYFHFQIIDRPFVNARSEFHQGIIQGDFKSPYQYRVLAPWLAEAGGRLVEKVVQLPEGRPSQMVREAFYSAERLVSLCLLFFFFHLFLEAYFSSELAFAGVLLLAGVHAYTYHSYFYQPDSPINLMFLAVGLYLIVRRGPGGWLYPLMIAASLNRETSGVIAALHLAYFGLSRKTMKHTAGLILVWAAVQILLRTVYGPRPSFEARPLWINLYEIHWPFFLFSFIWFVPLIYYSLLPQFFRRALLLFAPPVIAANFLFGKFEETRLFLDLSLILIPCTFIALFERSDIDPTTDRDLNTPIPISI
jgi:hypothetical protein